MGKIITGGTGTVSVWEKENSIIKTGTYIPQSGDGTILCDTSSANVTINLPSVASNAGMRICLHKMSTNNQVIINPNGGDTINSFSSWILEHQHDSIIIISDGGTGWHIISDNKSTNTVFFNLEYDANLGNHRVQNISGTGNHRFEFKIPCDYDALISLNLILVPKTGTDGAGKDIDMTSDYAKLDEAYNAHTESDTTSTYDFTGRLNKITYLDISGIFSNIAADDLCGIFIDHKSIGGTIAYLGLELIYKAGT